MRLREIGHLAGNIALAAICLFLAAVHLAGAAESGRWTTGSLLVVQQAILMGLFVVRRQAFETSTRVVDWVVGVVGTFLPLAMRPRMERTALAWVGEPVQVAGLLLAIAASGFLGRSVGVVAANRGVRTGGLYGIVRHPMYAGHLLGYLGFLTANPSGRNALVAAITVAMMAARAQVEERFLERDPAYRAYQSRTPWRFVPFVY